MSSPSPPFRDGLPQAISITDPISPSSFGTVKRLIGLVEQRLGGHQSMQLHATHANARGDHTQTIVVLMLYAQSLDGFTQALPNTHRCSPVCMAKDDGKLFSAISGGEITGSHSSSQHQSYPLEAVVSSLMPVAIVVSFEMVHIDHQQ